jgi:acetyl-CoA carboxylase carboxyl transferase subunit alpha
MRAAAEARRLTAQDLKQLGVNDRIIPEPRGGAHRDRKEAIASVRKAIAAMLDDLSGKDPKALVADRRKKFLDLGAKGLAA